MHACTLHALQLPHTEHGVLCMLQQYHNQQSCHTMPLATHPGLWGTHMCPTPAAAPQQPQQLSPRRVVSESAVGSRLLAGVCRGQQQQQFLEGMQRRTP